MPANLTPEYEKAELRYRAAASPEDRIAALEAMLAVIPKHKGTEKMQADLKRRLSQLRKAEQKVGHSHGPNPFYIPRSGAGQVVLAGPPNTGKSSLLAVTTRAEPKVGDYPFTTTVPLPGMWERENVQVELVDLPPMTPGHVVPGLMGTIRAADVVALVVEAGENALEQTESVLGSLETRGVTLTSASACELELGAGSGRLPGLIVANKLDIAAPGSVEALASLYRDESRPGGGLEVVGVSARLGMGLESLFDRFWALLARIRVYTKQPGKPPDLHRPFVLRSGATVADLALQIHRDLPEHMKYARLWGHSRFEGQQVHRTEVLCDRDVVEIHE